MRPNNNQPMVAPQSAPPRPRGASATNDPFGMMGFNQQDAQQRLYRPVDLNSLGIAVSSSEQLHLGFGSPWMDSSSNPQQQQQQQGGGAQPPPQQQQQFRLQPEFRIPECYYVTAPVIKYTLFQKLHLETLFYVFYSMPRDVLQVAAARELNSRDWRYHKPTQQWLTRVQGTEPKAVPGLPKGAAERGSYQIWNVERWCMERVDNFTLTLTDLEDTTATVQQQQAAQQQQQAAQQQAAAAQQGGGGGVPQQQPAGR
jgi:CCR4-NOT transcription complex subunit 2